MKFKKNQIVIYISIIIFCTISIIIASYVQFYARIDIYEFFGFKGEKCGFGNKTQDEIELLKAEFDQLFTNTMQNDNGNNDNKKINKEQKLVITKYSEQKTKDNSYDININIPYINIDNEIISKYNKEIEDIFVTKAKNILTTDKKNIIYSVEYVADLQDDILSLIIKSNLKEGVNAQRVIIQTYNYDLRNNKELSLEELLRIKQLDKQEIQSKIKNEIELQQKKVDDLKQLGYNIYDRDKTSNIYNVENTTEFYLTEDKLYMIYPYGNNLHTSEKDIIIL